MIFVVPLARDVFRSLQQRSAVSTALSASTLTHLTFANCQTLRGMYVMRNSFPCIVVYVGLQQYYARGLVSGALKG